MLLTKNCFQNHINTYTEDEEFYRKLYHTGQSSTTELEKTVKELDLNYVNSRSLYIPQIHSNWTDFFDENLLFSNGDISVQKHNRFTPIFFHEHKFYEILYVYKGECTNRIKNITELTCIEGDVLIIPPKTMHSIAVFDDSIIINILIKSKSFHTIFFELFTNLNVLSNFFSHSMYSHTENNYLLFRSEQDKQIKSLIEDIYIEFHNRERYYQSLLKGYLTTFWGRLLRYHENNIQIFLNSDKNHIKVIDILSFLQNHFQTITLQEAAEHFGFSTPYFSKIIKDSTGQSFIQIIRNIKLEKACELLKETNFTIITICEMIGYQNPEHFTRTFKKIFSLSPGEYRKKNQKKDL